MITCQEAVAKTIFDKYVTVHVGVRVLCTSATFCNLLTQELDLYVALYSQYIYLGSKILVPVFCFTEHFKTVGADQHASYSKEGCDRSCDLQWMQPI